ncbi:zinc-dependent alcohol dehydrogenase family protein [Nocardia arthritidis]|uniref:Zinc-binding dehydrogenase n=1 Tax=Nocardia arthritidis TaxID=228602 RepID=A0A6G9Y8J3_9NOCA|nr:NAD(P)-dependent alcohol dehydrogenase [Nocardia arthritidis]QIS09464.1 zinc-binding dehydrogenase [Nocardia arthritidis]
MKGVAYHLEPLRDLAGLSIRPQARPEPGPHQVVIEVRAASLNRRDLMLLDGTYPLPAEPGIVPLSDGVGVVVAVGEKVTRAALGDRVTATYYPHYIDGPQRLAHVRQQYGANFNGMLATYALLEEDSVVHVPEYLTDAEAASLTCAGVVSWAALTKPVPVRPDESVLTVGTGTVAIFAAQFGKLLGGRVISITSTERKAERLRKLGVDEVVVRAEHPDWEQRVLELTGGDGVDHVVDAVGGSTVAKSVRSGAYNARITMIGAMPTGENATGGDLFGDKYLSIRKIAVGSRADFEAMNVAMTEHRMRPVIDREFSFDEAVEAYRYFRDENPFGKVIVTM